MERLVGAKILSINNGTNDSSMLAIVTDKGTVDFVHEQDCCESVYLESGFDDLEKMVVETILFAEEVYEDRPPLDEFEDSFTWTFYKISTINHDCTLRFYGCSNGYYSESVELEFK
ncbi:MAG: DUF7448 domain-containing protein [Paraclostridium sp.]